MGRDTHEPETNIKYAQEVAQMMNAAGLKSISYRYPKEVITHLAISRKLNPF